MAEPLYALPGRALRSLLSPGNSTALADFAKSSFSAAVAPQMVRTLLPCPPPFGLWRPSRSTPRRLHARSARTLGIDVWVGVQILALNFQALAAPKFSSLTEYFAEVPRKAKLAQVFPYRSSRVGKCGAGLGMISATKELDGDAAAFASPATVAGFDAWPFLSARTAEAFATPDSLLPPESEQRCPPCHSEGIAVSTIAARFMQAVGCDMALAFRA